MLEFEAAHHGEDKLGLAELLEAFANDQWIGDHYTEEQSIEAILDRFKRAVDSELQMIELKVVSKGIVDESNFE